MRRGELTPISDILTTAREGIEMGVGYETCLVCRRKVEFAENQYSKACLCGNVITLPRDRVKRPPRENIVKMPRCFLCMDTGLVFYQAQERGQLHEFVARCKCETGKARKENYPFADRANNITDLMFLEHRAREQWVKQYRHGMMRIS